MNYFGYIFQALAIELGLKSKLDALSSALESTDVENSITYPFSSKLGFPPFSRKSSESFTKSLKSDHSIMVLFKLANGIFVLL